MAMVQIPIQRQAAAIQVLSPIEMPVETAAEIDCPITGEIVSFDDIDAMIDCYERVKAASNVLYDIQIKLRLALAGKTEGDAATRRVRGKRRAAKIEMPSVSFEQPVLKSLWNSHPKLAVEYLKIETIGVQMRPYAKLVNTSSDEADFTYFRDALTKACKGRVGTPTITPER